jgi:hypothetical protein
VQLTAEVEYDIIFPSDRFTSLMETVESLKGAIPSTWKAVPWGFLILLARMNNYAMGT